MIAASTVMGRTGVPRPIPDPHCFVALLALGADPAVTDPKGRTALGHFYGGVRATNDFKATFGFPTVPVDETVKAMLMPTNGPTAADLVELGEDDDDDDEVEWGEDDDNYSEVEGDDGEEEGP